MKKLAFKNIPVSSRNKDFLAEKQFLKKLEVRYEFLSTPIFRTLTHLDEFRLPEQGEQVRLRVQTQLNVISIILKIIETHQKIDSLHIITYAFNREALRIIEDLFIAQKIEHIYLYLSSSYTYRDKEYYEYIKQQVLLYDNTRFHLTFTPSHAKITLVQCGKYYYQMEGSMNFSTNTRAEHLLLENRKESYDADLQFIEKWLCDINEKALEIVC